MIGLYTKTEKNPYSYNYGFVKIICQYKMKMKIKAKEVLRNIDQKL